MNREILIYLFEAYRREFLSEDGSLFDRTVSSALVGQYHYGSFILCAVLAHNESPSESLREDIRSVFLFLNRHIDKPVVKSSIDFNIESICLAHWVCDEPSLKKILAKELIGYLTLLELDIKAHATDYYLLRYFNVKYLNKYLGCEIEINEKVKDVIESIKLSKGVLFDSYVHGNGIPDLTYHCRNLQLLQLCISILGEEGFSCAVQKGFQFLDQISSDSTHLGVYGRSPETAYGYSSLLLSLSFYKESRNHISFKSISQVILERFFTANFKDIEISIGGKKANQNRCGYDSYMYPIVYKLFTLSRCMLATELKAKVQIERIESPKTNNQIFIEVDSGVGVVKWKENFMLFNAKGHQYSQLRPNDSRYFPCIPYVLEIGGEWQAPLVPYQSPCKLPEENFLIKIKRLIQGKLTRFKYKTDYLGYHPVFINSKRKFVVSGNESIDVKAGEIHAESSQIIIRNTWRSIIQAVFCREKLKGIKVSYKLAIKNERVENHYNLNQACNVEYCVRVNVMDNVSFKGQELYLNKKKLMSYSLPVNKMTSCKVYQCTGGWVKIVTFSFVGLTRKFIATY